MHVVSQVTEMAGSDTAAGELMAELRPWLRSSGIRAAGNDVLIAMYNRAGKKSAGGIIIPGDNREDDFQGKVGLILSLGPLCCEERSEGYSAWFGGEVPKIGDWVGINRRDGMTFLLGTHTCHLVEWKYLRFLVTAPDKAQ